jgi:hypothetical protein
MQYELGVPGRIHFLGRYWSLGAGYANSCSSLRRVLRNLSVATIRMPDVDARRLKLVEKLYALWLTDQHTPGIKQLVKLIPKAYTQVAMDGSGCIHVPLTADTSYWATQSTLSKKYFTNEAAEWMLEEEVCGMDMEMFTRYMRFTKTLTLDGLLDLRTSPLRAPDVDLTNVPICLAGEELPKQRKPIAEIELKVVPSEALGESSYDPVVQNINNDNNAVQQPAVQESEMRKCSLCAETKMTEAFSKAQRAKGPEARCTKCTTIITAANGSTVSCALCGNTKASAQFPQVQLAKPKPKCRACCDKIFAEKQEKAAKAGADAPVTKTKGNKRNKSPQSSGPGISSSPAQSQMPVQSPTTAPTKSTVPVASAAVVPPPSPNT